MFWFLWPFSGDNKGSAAPIMIITMMMVTPMYSSVDCVAMPLSGVAVGAGVAAAGLA